MSFSSKVKDELLRLIAQQIMKDKRVSDTSAWRIRQLARAGEINRAALAIIDQYAGGISSEIAEAILAAAEGEVGTLDAAMLNLLSEKGKMTDEQRNMLDAFQRQSRQELNIENARIAESYAQALQEDCNLVNTVMGYQTASAYSECVRETAEALDRQSVINELNQGAMSVVSGTESLQEATRRTLERLAEKGIPGFVDKAGREWSPEAYVKMDLRSTMGNTARAAQDARCDRYGIQLIEVSSHMGARPKCAPYQGRIFSRNGTAGTTTDLNDNPIPYIPLSQTSYGEPDGLFGINCGHQQYPFIPGVSVKTYYPYPEEQNAERYQQFQQQRAMERKIRSDKRKCMMMQETGDEEGLRKAAGKLRADKDRYADFCKETGLGAHNENTQVYGYDRSKSMKTVWSEKKGLTGGASGGIIQEREVEYGVQYGEKAIHADMDYILSDEYKSKFSSITDIPAVNDALYSCSVDAITRRSGTLYENIYFINADTGEVLAKQLGSEVEQGVTYNDEIKDLLRKAKENHIPLISVHNHPEGLPPSIDDFNKSYENGTVFGLAVGHNGQVYKYDNPHHTIKSADDIHNIIDMRCRGGTDPDRAYVEEYSQIGLKYLILN